MHYVTETINYHEGIEAWIDNENLLTVREYETDDPESVLRFAEKRFDNSKKAQEAFSRVSTCIREGHYSFEDIMRHSARSYE